MKNCLIIFIVSIYFDNFGNYVGHEIERNRQLADLIEKLWIFSSFKFNEENRIKKQKIAIIYRPAKDMIYQNKPSSAHMDGSVYTVNEYAFVQGRDRNGVKLTDFKLLGDQACGSKAGSGGWNACGDLLLVKDISSEGDLLRKPDTAYNLLSYRVHPIIPYMVSFCRLKSVDSRYKCIGDVVTINRWPSLSDILSGWLQSVCDSIELDKYRCVKEETPGPFEPTQQILNDALLYRFVEF